MAKNPKTAHVTPWPLQSEQPVGDYGIFRLLRSVRRSPTGGGEHTFMRLDTPDWVNVIAVTREGGMLLVEQYRHGTDAVTLEIPGGMVDAGESAAKAAARELEEETGFWTEQLSLLGSVEPNPAFLSNTCWTYLALGCTQRGHAEPDPTEEIAVRQCSLAEFTSLIENGTIRHALVIAAHDHLRRALDRDDPSTRSLAPEPPGRPFV